MPFKKILVAVDREPIAARAVEVAVELATLAGADLAFINVIEPELVNAADTGVAPATIEAEARQEASRLIGEFTSRAALPRKPLEFVEIGGAAAEIVKAAKNWGADLVVVGSHGRGGLRRALLGSVAEGVMRHAACPVLVVRATG